MEIIGIINRDRIIYHVSWGIITKKRKVTFIPNPYSTKMLFLFLCLQFNNNKSSDLASNNECSGLPPYYLVFAYED